MKILVACLLVAVAQGASMRHKRNICSGVDQFTVGMFADPDNCAGYIQCSYGAPVKRCCNAGLQWDDSLQTCNWKTSCTKSCSTGTTTPSPLVLSADECVVGNYIYQVDDSSPNQYHQSTLDRKTKYQNVACAPATPLWSLVDCTCVPDPNAPSTTTKSVPSTTPPKVNADECLRGNYIYQSNPNNPNMYNMLALDRTVVYADVPCPASVPVWSPEPDCTCIADTNSAQDTSKCKTFSYDSSFATSGVWVASAFENVELRDGRACFSGGVLDIPFYDNAFFGHALTMEMDIVNEGTQGRATLFTNGDTPDKASIAAYFHSNKITVDVRASGQPTTCSATVNSSNWEHLKVTFDGAQLSVTTWSGKKTVPCTGNIHVVSDPVYLGRDLSGCIDNLKICNSV